MKEIIYLDHVMVNSLLAQRNQGLAQKLVQSFESGKSETQGNDKVNTTEGTVGGGILGAALSESRASNNERTTSNNNSETTEIILNDFALDILMDTQDIASDNYVEGGIAIKTGKPEIYNFARLKSIMSKEIVSIFDDSAKFDKEISSLQNMKNSQNKKEINSRISALKNEQSKSKSLKNFETVRKLGVIGDALYPNSALIKIGDFICICPKENLRINEATLSLYNEKTLEIHCLGIIIYQRGETYIQHDEQGEVIQLKANVIAASSPTMIMDILLDNFGLGNKSDYIVKPIAIYYDMG